ncbi:MAG: DUF2867 domain-containing protein [Chloroflexi bacterium]|nr:DUF2867 domain-containing protein [Chloroflexota bacterium]
MKEDGSDLFRVDRSLDPYRCRGATYHFAPRVGPNPIFGVRTGYSMANRTSLFLAGVFGDVYWFAVQGKHLMILASTC